MVAVEWAFAGVHSRADFNGLRASGRNVDVRGITLFQAVDVEGGQRLGFRRYVDWARVFAQLGLTLSWRIPLLDPAVTERPTQGQ